MDMELIKFGFQVLQFLLLGGISIYVYISNRDRVTNSRISQMETGIDNRLDGQGERIAKLESASSHAINHVDLGEVYKRISAVDQRLSHLEGENKAQSDTLRLILNQITQKGMQ